VCEGEVGDVVGTDAEGVSKVRTYELCDEVEDDVDGDVKEDVEDGEDVGNMVGVGDEERVELSD